MHAESKNRDNICMKDSCSLLEAVQHLLLSYKAKHTYSCTYVIKIVLIPESDFGISFTILKCI